MISHPMIQFGEIAEMMFRLFSHLDYGRSCSVKSPNGYVKLEDFPDGSWQPLAWAWRFKSPSKGLLSLEGYKSDHPSDDGCIHSDFPSLA